LKDPEGLARGFSNISRTYFASGKTLLALQYADSSLKYGIPITALEHIVTAYDIKMQGLKKLKNFAKALEMSELFKLYSDSLMNERKILAVKGIEFKYQTIALEEENVYLRRQSETDAVLILRHKKIIISIAVAIAMFAIVILLLILIQRKQKHYNRSLEKKNNIITSQNRNLDTLNRTKDKMLSVISHDLRGTIGNQLTALSVLAREEFKDEEERKIVFTRLANSATLSLELLENLSIWTRIQEDRMDFQPEIGSLKTSVRNVLLLYKESLENKELTLQEMLEGSGEFSAYYDLNMIKNVLKNLLSNAIKFTPRGGEIKLILSSKENSIEVCVKDKGIGIEESDISMLNQNLQISKKRGTENEKGSGLGLQIVNTFLEHHKTRLIIFSAPNKGSSVSFELPLHKP
jgi:signal transduction histidine kinase